MCDLISSVVFKGIQTLPDVSFYTALSSELVLHQVRIVGRGDKVMAQRLTHILEDAPSPWVEYGALSRAEVHQESVKCHGIQQLGWKGRMMLSEPSNIAPESKL